jgi:hypothetical protein
MLTYAAVSALFQPAGVCERALQHAYEIKSTNTDAAARFTSTKVHILTQLALPAFGRVRAGAAGRELAAGVGE